MLLGLHHVTALAGNPQRNLDFYTRVAGLRLVKRTVNFDDPASYHFYFSAGAGTPGTLLTFFPWATERNGVRGSGQIAGVGLRLPKSPLSPAVEPDGIAIELIQSARSPGLQSVTLREADAGPTVAFLRDVLGLKTIREEPACVRLEMADGAYAVITTSAISGTASLIIETQYQCIMDWPPRWSLDTIADWSYYIDPVLGDTRQSMFVKYH
jgi:catechol 2,3-dioxygenase-like lactoylglutathione lyase family enzyme